MLCIAGTAAVWIGLTSLFWVGYAGADDLSYARYAYFLHRPPLSWWEFRLPAVLAIRASFLLFGPSEFAAAIPFLLSSVAISAAVAWLVDWPRTLTWESQGAVLLATAMPIDVGFRSCPAAPLMAAALLSLGTAAMVKGRGWTPYLGAVLLGLGFLTHEISLFYIAIFCFTALYVAPQRFWRPVACCVMVSAALLAVEAMIYAAWLGDPLARLKAAANTTARATDGIDPDGLMTNVAFLLWPVQNLVYCKQFGFTLGAVFTFGAAAWRRLSPEERILLATTFLSWAWLGYGSQVPWDYKPLFRQFHYYSPLVIGTAVVLPRVLAVTFSTRASIAHGLILCALGVHVVSLTAGGRWGAPVDVSRELLSYATRHPADQFITDVETLNHMYVLNGFRLPSNVVAMRTPLVDGRLIVNWEPPGAPRFRFPITTVDGVLINREQGAQRPYEPEFQALIRTLEEPAETVVPVTYRPLFAMVTQFTSPPPFMVRSLGGNVIRLRNGERTNEPVTLSPSLSGDQPKSAAPSKTIMLTPPKQRPRPDACSTMLIWRASLRRQALEMAYARSLIAAREWSAPPAVRREERLTSADEKPPAGRL